MFRKRNKPDLRIGYPEEGLKPKRNFVRRASVRLFLLNNLTKILATKLSGICDSYIKAHIFSLLAVNRYGRGEGGRKGCGGTRLILGFVVRRIGQGARRHRGGDEVSGVV